MAMFPVPLADLHDGVFFEGVDRHFEIERRRTFADAARGVVLRAVAWAVPAAELAARIGRLLTERYAAQMRADADQDQPFGLLDAGGIGLRVAQARRVVRDLAGRIDHRVGLLGGGDLVRRAVADED